MSELNQVESLSDCAAHCPSGWFLSFAKARVICSPENAEMHENIVRSDADEGARQAHDVVRPVT
jgi:hypothetical protein